MFTSNGTVSARWGGLVLLAGGLLLLLAGGCGSPRRGEPVVGPLPVSSPEIKSGQLVFMRHCHLCHPEGEGGLGPSLNEKPLPAFLLRTQVRRGLGVMPAFGPREISGEQLDALVAYLIALRRHDRPTPTR